VVVFTGYVSDVARYLSAMDAFALCSKWEGLPNVVLQAMSGGLPIVCSNVGGCGEVVDDGSTGLLFSSGCRAGFSAAVMRLLGEQGLSDRLRLAGLLRVRDHFSLTAMVERYGTFFRDVQPGTRGDWLRS